MTAERLAKVDDVIEHGQDIPANVRAVADRNAEAWERSSSVDFQRPHRPGRVTVRDLARQEGPLTVVEVDHEPQPADDEPVHYVVPEFGPSGATLCGIGIEEDGNLSTTGEPGKGTCRDCRIAVDEEPGGTASDAELLQLIDERDDAHEWADRLAQAIAEFLHIDIGEHSNYNLPWQAALIALTDTVSPQPAESGLLELTLPEVPAEAVALVDRHGRRWALRTKAPQQSDWLWESESEAVRTYGALLIGSGPLTVELAPPRKPRTWPKIDGTEDLPALVDVDGHGRWKRNRGTDVYGHETEKRGFYSHADLRELGEVREVLGDA